MDMSFGEIINMYKDKELIISPEYQRAFRWDKDRQTAFIETILLGMPFPPIFVSTNNEGKWELIDGLQRVSTVLSFFNELNESDGTESSKNGLVLKKGSLVSDLEGIKLVDLPLEYKLQIKRTSYRVEIIQKDSDFTMSYELFKRLNTGGDCLSRQEIRNCIYRGYDNTYNKHIFNLAMYKKFQDIVIISESEIEKMHYQELVLRFFVLKNCGTNYKNKNIQDYMDKYLEEQSMKRNPELIENDNTKFIEIINFLHSLNVKEIFKKSPKSFATSMYDSIMLVLNDVSDLTTIDQDQFITNIFKLRDDDGFNKYVGSASSNPTSITQKVNIAKKILLDKGI